VQAWSARNAEARTVTGKGYAPDRNDEYLFYQSLLGAWAGETQGEPLAELRQRMRDYMVKAIKEAKRHTSWVAPHEAYEKGVAQFVDTVLHEESGKGFLQLFLPFAQRVAHCGVVNSLAQVVLKVMSPGVVDFYQGSELWDLSLVDPDNRRPVSYEHRMSQLQQLSPLLEQCLGYATRRRAGDRMLVGVGAREGLADRSEPGMARLSQDLLGLLERWEDGAVKLFVTAALLRLRRRFPELLLEGQYVPLELQGVFADHLVAFARQYQDQRLIVIVPRLTTAFMQSKDSWPVGMDTWKQTRLQLPAAFAGRLFRGLFSPQEWPVDSESWNVGELLGAFPAGVYFSGSSASL
jgi:(1->4)-alpha-D-glucan 1-alpha-D-glucosylmutase